MKIEVYIQYEFSNKEWYKECSNYKIIEQLSVTITNFLESVLMAFDSIFFASLMHFPQNYRINCKILKIHTADFIRQFILFYSITQLLTHEICDYLRKILIEGKIQIISHFPQASKR